MDQIGDLDFNILFDAIFIGIMDRNVREINIQNINAFCAVFTLMFYYCANLNGFLDDNLVLLNIDTYYNVM